MGARRRGLHRHSRTKDKATEPEESVTAGNVEAAPPAPRARASLGLKPSSAEVIAAIVSLYEDQLKPFGRILRKRVAEHSVASDSNNPRTSAGYDHLPDVDIKHLRETCEGHENLLVEPEEGGDWSAVLKDREPDFVNVYSSADNYMDQMWTDAAEYFEGLAEDDMLLPGGRYSCAQALMGRALPFLAGRSLGEICHVVQLAISKRKILGYSNGAVVPYNRSQSMVKERCAEWQQPCLSSETGVANTTSTASGMPLADWETARTCLREILDAAAEPEQGPHSIPLSNVKRLFRSKYHLELSETSLGHSKLSELLQDERFADVCTVQLQGHGYIVVQAEPPKGAIALVQNVPAGFCDVPLLADASLGSPRRLDVSSSDLCLEDTSLFLGGDSPGPLPFATPSPSPTGAMAPFLPRFTRWPTSLALSPSTLSKDGHLGGMVQNTFIHAAPPPPTPPPGARQRARSLPKDVGSDKSDWESSCNALGFLPRPLGCDSAASTAESSGSSAPSAFAGPGLPQSPTPSSARGRLDTDGCGSPLADSAPMKVALRSPLSASPSGPGSADALRSRDGYEETAAPQRILFCPDEPLSLEDAGIVDRAPPGLFAVPEAPRWPSLSLSPSFQGVGSMVQNTFIHAPPTPITPAPHAVRRSRSLPKDVGSAKNDLESPRGARPQSGGTDLTLDIGYPPSIAASPGPAFVPPSPALTASPLPLYAAGGGLAFAQPFSPPNRVLRLADLL